jgi:hypothetical protein
MYLVKLGLFWTQMKEEMAISPIGAIWSFWLAAWFVCTKTLKVHPKKMLVAMPNKTLIKIPIT